MDEERLDRLVTDIIATAAKSLPLDFPLKVDEHDRRLRFFFSVRAERGGILRGQFEPFDGIKHRLKSLLNMAGPSALNITLPLAVEFV
ncbi:MAG: hypothetical protein ACJ74W_16845 [Pyrinomonadaceae bacterium]